MIYRTPGSHGPGGPPSEEIGRIILAGGEVLLPEVREQVLYPAIEQIVGRYRSHGGVKVVVQTTGDLVTPSIVAELLNRGVWMIAVSGMDDYHEGMHEARRMELTRELSGVLNFLNLGFAGSEVSIDPAGDVYPCCPKMRTPLGNIVEEPLLQILESLVGHPSLEAITMGHPERMGIHRGWSPEKFFERSRARKSTPGRVTGV